MDSWRQSDDGIIMEGWLYLIRSKTIGFKYSRKLYYVLQNHRFNTFTSISHSHNKDPIRSTVVDSSIHVMDNGRKCIRGKVLFVFTLCDTSSYAAHVKLGASNPEEAAKWIKSFQELSKRDRHPALSAVSVIEEAPEVIFQTLIWDFCFQKGSVIENIDDHTDIVHQQLNGDWLPWSMKQRDLLLQRYWRREDNGTYIILYHSVFNNKCPPQKGVIRARLKCGGYVIYPGNQYKQSAVRHMLAIDWKSWRHNLHKSSDRCLTIHMLERLAGCFFTRLKTDSLLHKKETDQSNLVKTDDESDEFFDFSEPLFDDGSENSWAADNNPGIYTQDAYAKAEKKHEFGPWILRHTIRLPALIGNLLKINYIHGKNYLEMDVDVGSSECARGVAGKTFSCFSSLIMEIAFVIQATTRDELPEHLLGACRLSNLDVSKAVWANP
ncbi:hypothetical protein L1987_36375 [Smallanthus sonchifolius]|uniref:Uncharacterized protein n=1 Tax=Smallanthus sonchifolius TaxID=185202 RepID=A0ACB9HE94_9ASTR|nr:hypothetical protein L1987_36375 [Smallanthus sonchifolius]